MTAADIQREENSQTWITLFETVFAQSPVSIQIFAPDGETLAVNRAWEKRWGTTLEKMGGYNVLQDRQLVEKGIMPFVHRAFAGESVQIPPVKYVPDETISGVSQVPYRWVAASAYPVFDDRGHVIRVVLMHEDITERKLAEDALRESEARFRAIFDEAPIGISLIDPDGCYVAANRARQEMLGYSADELSGRSYLDFTHPDDLDYDAQVNEQARTEGRRWYQLEKRFVRKNGETAWARMTIQPVRNEQGDTLYSISIAEDITDRKHIEEERARLYELERIARQNMENLAAERSAILGQIVEGILMADTDGRLTFINEEAARIYGVAELGVTPDEYSHVYHVYTMDGDPYPSHELPLARAALYNETSVNVPLWIKRPDGTEVFAVASASPVTAEDGTRLGAVLAVRDVTEQHNLDRQKDEFLSAAAHDLRTPLTNVKGRVQLIQKRLERGPMDKAQLLKELERSEASLKRMETVISELLDVANLQIGRPLALHRTRTNLVDLVRGVVLEHDHVSGHHPMTVEARDTELVGEWDADRLERALANLLSNAMKYSPAGGDILVSVQREGDAAALMVADRGIGIPPEDLPHIFDRFRRGRNVAGRIAGTGIGLATVRDIVEQHGGTIQAANREGGGAMFTLYLPLTASPPLASS